MKQKYYDWHKTEPGYMDIIDSFLESNLVLDVGCGSGWVGKHLSDFNSRASIIGLDIDSIGLREAKKYEKTIVGNANMLPFKDSIFDGIIVKDVLEHTLNPLSMILELNRILKKGNKIYISVPDVKSKSFYDDYTHIRPFNKKSLVHLVEDGGFNIEKLWYSGSWPGLGILMHALNINKLPKSIKLLARLNFRRQNINIIISKR